MENTDTLDESFINKEDELQPVSSWVRLANTIIDGTLVGLVQNFMGLDSYDLSEGITLSSYSTMFMYNAIFLSIYYLLCEGLSGVTLGKLVTRTKVVDHYGVKPSIGKIFIRTISRIIPFEPLSFLFSRVGWHDSLSSTIVVRK